MALQIGPVRLGEKPYCTLDGLIYDQKYTNDTYECVMATCEYYTNNSNTSS
jgi:hypothetical protein